MKIYFSHRHKLNSISEIDFSNVEKELFIIFYMEHEL